MRNGSKEIFIITYLDICLVTYIIIDKVITFGIELFVKNRAVALSDHLNDPAFVYIINRYNEELCKLFKNV
ncbi:MAG: hypothetical protein D6752_06700, partial [Candidatus Nitrosothermus koennekii]